MPSTCANLASGFLSRAWSHYARLPRSHFTRNVLARPPVTPHAAGPFRGARVGVETAQTPPSAPGGRLFLFPAKRRLVQPADLSSAASRPKTATAPVGTPGSPRDRPTVCGHHQPYLLPLRRTPAVTVGRAAARSADFPHHPPPPPFPLGGACRLRGRTTDANRCQPC